MSAKEKWKRRYFRVLGFARRLVRELRKSSPWSAEVAERKLASIACPYGYGQRDARPGGAKPRGCPGHRNTGPLPVVRLRGSGEEAKRCAK